MLRTRNLPRASRLPFVRLVIAALPVTAMGACTHLDGQREAYLHSRQIIVEMDLSPQAESLTRVASWPGPEYNLTLVRGDSHFPSELAQANVDQSATGLTNGVPTRP